MGRLQVNLLGASFAVKAPEDDQYLNKLLAYYTDITKSIQAGNGMTDPLQISIVAGITLVDELLKAKKQNLSAAVNSAMQHSNEQAKTEQLAKSMIDKIDAVL